MLLIPKTPLPKMRRMPKLKTQKIISHNQKKKRKEKMKLVLLIKTLLLLLKKINLQRGSKKVGRKSKRLKKTRLLPILNLLLRINMFRISLSEILGLHKILLNLEASKWRSLTFCLKKKRSKLFYRQSRKEMLNNNSSSSSNSNNSSRMQVAKVNNRKVNKVVEIMLMKVMLIITILRTITVPIITATM